MTLPKGGRWCGEVVRGRGMLVLAAAVALLFNCAVAVGSPLVIDSDRQFDLAESLFAEGEYSGAVIEYRRFVHFFPEDSRVETAGYRIGRSLYNDGRYAKAVAAFYDLIDRFPDGRWAVQAYLGISACHLKNNAPGQAVAVLEQLAAVSDDPDVIDDANFRVGWIYLEQADWERSRAYFNRVRPESRSAYRVQQLTAQLDQVDAIPRKEPTTAGMLAVLPGAGHVYCGRYKDGLIAFVVNTALILAAVESFDNDLPVLGGVITAVGLGFYAGSIYSAVGSAHKYNRKQERKFIDGLKRNAQPAFSFGISDGGVVAALRIPF